MNTNNMSQQINVTYVDKEKEMTNKFKAGGTPVFNGEFRECFGVKTIN